MNYGSGLKCFNFFIISIGAFGVFACSHTHPLSQKSINSKIHYAKNLPGANRENRQDIGTNYMITTQGDASSEAGRKIFAQGGNAIDAAVAISFAISVERPQSTGIGGGGFMLVHFADTNDTLAIDFREMAPALASERMYLDKAGNVIPKLSLEGALSVGVPGLVAGLYEVHKKYGALKWHEVVAPSIELAEKGFTIYPHLAEAIEQRKEVLAKFPSSRKIFFDSNGTPLKEGTLLRQIDLGKTLRTIQSKGRSGFYDGWVAKAIVENQKKLGGIIRANDLRGYTVKFREPVWGKFNDYRIASMPPPSSGGTHVIQILNILEGYSLKEYGPFSDQAIHWTASATQQAFADRATYLGDSDFVKVPVAGLTNKNYAVSIRNKISRELAKPSSKVKPGNPWPFKNPYESSETTHFTVMDSIGNTVSSTQTINYYFGSGIVVDGTGIILNDEMDDFSAKPGAKNVFGAVGSTKNRVQPGKRPLSSMSPTIVFEGKSKSPMMALGTPSGTRIITCVAQTVLNYLLYGMSLYDSVASIRYHHQWSPDMIMVDEPGFSNELTFALQKRGHSVRKRNLGCRVNAIAKEGTKLIGVSDPRGEGRSIGN